MSRNAVIGVLAFQGDVIEHMEAVRRLGAHAREVRSTKDLHEVQGLIIPGGESTVIGKFLRDAGLLDAILARRATGNLPVYGTCAGMILLAREIIGGVDAVREPVLPLMDIAVERNAYGSQMQSFEAALELTLPSGPAKMAGIFIRAPKVVRVGPAVRVLAEHAGFPVALLEGSLLASTFHPELSDAPSPLHAYFLSLVCFAHQCD